MPKVSEAVQLRALLVEREILIAPGAYDGISGRST